MLRKYSALANFSLAVAGSAALVGGQVAGVAASIAPAAYQNAITTSVSIAVVPSAKQGTCVNVSIVVSSDAGSPTGSVKLSIDGALAVTKALPSSGSVTSAVNCGGTGTASRVLHGTVDRGSIQNVAFVTAASTSSALSVGDHTLTADYVPTGNWAPSEASANLNITSATGVPTGVVPGSAGFPTSVDAGLSSLHRSGLSGTELRAGISGAAAVLALGAVAVYRRRATR